MKNLSVRISRLNHMENRRLAEIREQISLKQCFVRLQRCNTDDGNSHLDDDSERNSRVGAVVAGNRSCCIRVERLNYIPISR